MGLRYMTIPATDDVRFSQDAGNSNSPVYSIDSTGQNTSTGSNLTFSPYSNLYQNSLGSSTYTSPASSYFSPSSSLFSMPDLKPRIGSSYTTSSTLSSLSRSPLPHLSHPTSPISTRDIYTGATPYLRRTDHHTRSPILSGTVRGVPLSPTSSGFTSPMSNMDGSLGGSACPPLFPTEVIYSLQTSDGSIIKPEIFGRIDKGFFMADNDWTCYRRNYFSLQCSYTLTPTIPTGKMYLVQPHGPGPQVHNLAMSIAAVVDGKDGKAIELVQHTPKRDKGPQEKPARVTLAPRPAAPHGIYGDSGRAGLYESGFNSNPNQPAIEATFERIQFKNATANNGKRRAAQQYYHLLVELFADVGGSHSSSSSDRWIKIASRMSAPMVVRGRSPGHYQNERRGSNTSSGGPGGSGGGAGNYTPSGATSRTGGDMSMPGSSSMLPGSAYSNSYDTRSHHYRSHGNLQLPLEPTLSAEEASRIVDPPGYLYCPGAIYEGQEERYLQLPSMAGYTTTKVKSEFGVGGSGSGLGGGSLGSGHAGYMLPSLSSTGGSHCGRWEGTFESKGFFPNALMQGEMNIT